MHEHRKTTQASPDRTSTGIVWSGLWGANIGKQEKNLKLPQCTAHAKIVMTVFGIDVYSKALKTGVSFDSFVSAGVTSCPVQEAYISRVYP